MNTVKIEKGNTLMVAHRGLSGIERENTGSAFVAAGTCTARITPWCPTRSRQVR